MEMTLKQIESTMFVEASFIDEISSFLKELKREYEFSIYTENEIIDLIQKLEHCDWLENVENISFINPSNLRLEKHG